MSSDSHKSMTKTGIVGHLHGHRHLFALLLISGAASAGLFLHGYSLWYAPLSVVLAHALLIGIALSITGFVAGGLHVTGKESMLIHRPRMYDLLVKFITFGGERRMRRWALALGDLQPGDRILDVGCGTGSLLLAAAERIGPDAQLHGIEPAAEMVAHARHKAAQANVTLEVIQGSADSLPYEDRTFNAVFCTLALHHMPAEVQQKALGEMARVLRPGGRLVVVDLQRPTSWHGTIRSGLTLVTILHSFGPGKIRHDHLDIEPELKRHGLGHCERHSYGSGAIGAVVGAREAE